MKDLLLLVHALAKRQLPDFPEVAEEVCMACGECCSDSVHFFKSEIKLLRAKHKNLFLGVRAREVSAGEFVLFRKKHGNGGSGENPCVFYDVDRRRCQVYADRPLICRLYGQSPIAACGYEGLGELPEDTATRRSLSTQAKRSNIAIMAALSVQGTT